MVEDKKIIKRYSQPTPKELPMNNPLQTQCSWGYGTQCSSGYGKNEE
jgi:hypothetical protein